MSKIKPAPNYLLIKPIEEESVSAGGVYVPETSKDKPAKGEVVVVGEFMKTKDTSLVLYDFIKNAKTVVYKKWTNQEIKHKGEDYLLVHINELLAVIK